MSISIFCKGEIKNTPYPLIFQRGFVYSQINSNPTIGGPNCLDIPGTMIDITGFTATINNLLETSDVFIKSYATNSQGTVYSSNMITIVVNKPTMTVKIVKNDVVYEAYEMGTQTQLVVSGTTTPNNETKFNTLSINQISSPIVPNPIKTWTGLKTTFRSDETPPANINFSPIHTNDKSWTIEHNLIYNCGTSPNTYNITASTIADAVFPYMWVLKSGSFVINLSNVAAYCAGTLPYNTNNYFFYEASTPPLLPNNPINGKLIVKKKEGGTFYIEMTPTASNYKLIFGFPKSYGTVQFKINDGTWFNPSYSGITGVSTGTNGGNFGIVNSWLTDYQIAYHQFSAPFNKIKLYFRH